MYVTCEIPNCARHGCEHPRFAGQGRQATARRGGYGGVLRRPAVCILEEAAEDLRWGLGRLWVRLAWLLRRQKGIPFFSDLCDSSCRGTSTAGGDLCHDRSILTESTPLCNRFNWCVGCSITRFAESRWWHGAKMVGMVLQRARGMQQPRSRLAMVSPKQRPMRLFSLSPPLCPSQSHFLSASLCLSLSLTFPFQNSLPPSLHPSIHPSIHLCMHILSSVLRTPSISAPPRVGTGSQL